MGHTRRIAERIERDLDVPGMVDALGSRIGGADLTSLLMEIARSRAASVEPSTVIDRHEQDRFARPSPIGLGAIRRVEDVLLSSMPEHFDLITVSPLVPFAAHHALGGVPQNNVVSTIRSTEVAADPTVGLALEAAARRRRVLSVDPRSPEQVRLATSQRVTRAQSFDQPRSFAHFSLVGLVSAGRDTGSLEFEKQSVSEHVTVAASGILRAGASRVHVALTDFSGTMDAVLDHVAESLADHAAVSIGVDPQRTHARGYYPSVCFKLHARLGGDLHEYGDGGLVDWGTALLGNQKERMMISGVSVDRLAIDT